MIILTGGAGFVGSNLLRRLNAEGRDDVLVVDNLTNADKYRNLVGKRYLDFVDKRDFYGAVDRGEWDREPIDVILHQGACTNTMEYDGAYMMRTNYEASRTLLQLALRRKARMIYASTAAVYGHTSNAVEIPECEAPLNIYGFSKLAFDNYIRRLSPDADQLVVGLRYFNVYGHGEQHKGRMASMVYQFAKQIQKTGVAQLFSGIGPYGPGQQTRDFVSVDDLVEINMFFLTRDPVTAIVNAGSGVRSSWNEMAQAVICALGVGRVEYVDFPESLRSKYQFDTMADLTALRSLGYTKPMVELTAGVKAYVGSLEEAEQRFRPAFSLTEPA